METIHVSRQTHRRFVMGRQGLWPGRRWKAKEGAAQAIRECEGVQLDPLNIGARSQDIFLYSRVLDYRTGHLYQLIYEDRRFFDFGGALFVYPIEEFPYWRLHMKRLKANPHWNAMRHVTREGLEFVRKELRSRGPLGNRDFKGPRTLHSYRGGKESALCLYYLWLSGEIMVHHRVGFDRVYDLRQNILPPELDFEASEADCVAFFARKSVAEVGLARRVGWKNSINNYLQTKMSPQEAGEMLEAMIETGQLASVQVEGEKFIRYALIEDTPLLESLENGGTPPQWEPLEATTEWEAVILAPLDIVSARGRAMKLFDFEYLWDVYKPAHQRRWGYYNVPVLFGDRLVARLEPRLDKSSGVLRILGFWPEDDVPVGDPEFASAFTRGLRRFAGLMGAKGIDLGLVNPSSFRIAVEEQMSREFGNDT